MGIFKKAKDQMAAAQAMQEQAIGAMQGAGAAMGAGGMMGGMPSMGDATEVNRRGQDIRRIMDTGLPGRAIIKDVRLTDVLAGNQYADVDFIVTMDGGDPYPTTMTQFPAMGLEAGAEYAVAIDPEDRSKIAITGE